MLRGRWTAARYTGLVACVWIMMGLALSNLCTGATAAGDVNSGISCGEAETSPGFRTYMPDCRAYELVTPPYVGGQVPFGKSGFTSRLPSIAPNGERLLVIDFAGFAGTEQLEQSGFEFGATYGLTRTPMGWTAESLEPPASQYPRSNFVSGSADLGELLWEVFTPARRGEELTRIHPNDADLVIRKPAGGGKGSFTAVGPLTSPEHESSEEEASSVTGASSDLRYITINVRNVAKQLWPGDETASEGKSLYEYQVGAGAEPVLVGVKNSGPLKGSPHINEGAELISRCGTILGSISRRTSYNAISESGASVFFTALACGEEPNVDELYARVNGSRTLAVSEPPITGARASECTGVCLEDENAEAGKKRSPALFQGASSDGAKVFFTTTQPLLDVDKDTSSDLYEAELSGGEHPEVQRLVMLSEGAESDATRGEGADVGSVLASSENGAGVYFEATGVLTTQPNGNGEQAEPGQANVYRYDTETGRTAFVTVEPDTAVQTTHDGRFLVFGSANHIDNTNDSSTAPQLFEYDANTESVVRVSAGQKSPTGAECPTTKLVEPGYNCDGNISVEAELPVFTEPGNFRGIMRPSERTSALSVSNSGTVVFVSPDPLTPQAVVGGENVYEYRSGNVYLISPGDEAAPIHVLPGRSRFMGLDESGEDVYFTSSDSLVPQDVDTQSSFYDAREGGGFAAPRSEAECVGSECRGPVSAAPLLLSTPGSSLTSGVVAGAPGPEASAPVTPAKSKPKSAAATLAQALKACRKKPKKKRAECERTARRHYAAAKKKGKR
jgi:hypothetical protein